ncbi:hypothetical protein [Cellulomonas denverensis]|uniref:Lipoprotein n=1 Tax=Cellulomonas denverensis TaxID=264297 RepID=A0A7X6QZ67_9CELL|nr:hypothetical protein [Cellulomonas denverensis]NKY22929.1 hypothetical protein [Cellulomonas denverensis]GIG23997.1 hypothetical protein Cde04nite_02410 [Cellulomonas denverensis]
MARSRTSALRRASAVAAVALAAALSGCSVTNQITSQMEYDASDGVGAALGDISAENLVLIAAAADQPGALQGALSNRGDQATVVELTVGDDSATLRIPAGETVLLGGTEGEEVILVTPDAPGATTELTLSTATAGTETLPVPVLDGTLPEYTDLVPEPEDTLDS